MTDLLQDLRNWPAARGRDWDRFWFEPAHPRTLGVMRILVGAMLVYTHLVWGLRLEGFFGSQGWMPPDLMGNLYESPSSPSFWWAVPDAHLWTIHWLCVAVLVLFTFGVATPVTSVLAFVITVSYANRARLANFGLDQINALLTLYLAIGPSGAALSVDRLVRLWLRGPHPVEPSPRANMALRLIQVHYCIIYIWAGMSKLQGTAWWNGLSFWLAVANQEYQSWDLTWLAWYPWLVNVSTHVTIFWELTFWGLVSRKNWRVPMILLGILLHLGIGAFMGMWTFCWIMIFGYLAFVPDLVDRAFARRATHVPLTARQTAAVVGCLLCLVLAGCREPENTPAILHERGRMLLAHDKPREAIESYRLVLQVAPDNPFVHYDLGVAQARLGDHEAALASYTTALKLNPDYREALVNRADVLNQLGRHAEAAEDCSIAVELSATDVLAWQNYALANRGLGNLDRAVATLRVALALDPDHPRGRLIDAQLALDRGAPQNALEAFSSLIAQLEREPSQRTLPLPSDYQWLLATALMGRSAVWESLGNLDRASADRERARTLHPNVQSPKPIPRAPTPS